ncbi:MULTISPECIES: phage tail protein [Klebsiella]|uniref:phage tail protein n=1 Tax=Klebsiella TaxID=570 RepID=UPI0020A71808|nr:MULTISPECIES: phage tail protein [Klebsiella]EMF1915518.1 phage tail protein [Klebsiella quasipneumoniae]HCI6178846.1 phage tail protein [Klebsiella quasipneumoniae subsp. quasipneumoniae]HDX9022405.1 phage tail protein [Klebsiella oxytoca]MCP3187158.1 phage tail protein [Klebsiella pneumoniae]WEJ90708.1 MAG: phage tail protein [Klebsiella huaxiensis]
MGMTLDRINEYFAFATSALVTGVGVMTVSEKLALAGLLLGIVSAVRLAIHRRRIEQASQRRNDLIEQILHQAESRNLSDRERQLLEQLHGDKPA